MTGKILSGRYRIEELIGSGGMANVYKAYDEKVGHVVAIKMLKDEHREDAEFLRRFEREARAVLILSHPNIVQSYDVGVDDEGRNYIVLEYVEGCTLKEYIKMRGFLPAKEAANIASQVLDALEHAHSKGIIHRDVKPQNVMLASGGRAKLTDFGIAREASASTRTFAGTSVIGSAHYLSPEQARGEDVSNESDIYSAAVMLYEMLTGAVPFVGDNSVTIALKHIQEEMIPPNEVNPKVSRAMSDVVMKGAAKDPALRYHTAAEMKRDVQRALKEPHGRFASVNKKKTENKGNTLSAFGILKAIIATILVFFLVLIAVKAMDGDLSKQNTALVPSLLGKTLNEAKALADLRGFELSVKDYVISEEYPAGQVSNQDPVSGAKVREGVKINVEVSSGSGYAIVPELIGSTLQDASLKLAEENLNIGTVEYAASDKPEGQIIKQEPEPGTRAVEFDAVNVWISGSESNAIEMPSLTGKPYGTAVELLVAGGAQQIWVRTVAPGEEQDEGQEEEVVVQQSPAAGISVSKNSPVEISIARSDQGKYAADIAFNLNIEAEKTAVVVTAVLENGIQLVLYETTLNAGEQQPVSFTGFMRERGEHECIVYQNGVELKRTTANFTVR